ncbi:MAG TPA: lipopolysaccharide heptosyltransferase II [Candidatus Binataceae bacterium]|nr:lipopolysaccharide heptosyltransferase II [Candidatus Binataceae bacterium]
MVQDLPEIRDGRRPPARGLNLSFVAGRVLVKEVNWLGDLVISLPALRAIRAAYAHAKLAVLVRQELAGFFDGIGWVDEVIPYTIGRHLRGVTGGWRIAHQLRSRQFDLAVLFPSSFQSALWVTLAGIPRRAGYTADGRGFMLSHRATPPPDALEGHQAYYWLAMVRETLGLAPVPDAQHHRLEVGVQNLARMTKWLESRRHNPDAPLVAIAPAAAYGPAKEWPLVRYAALIDLMASRFGAETLLVGAPSERTKCEQVAASARSGALVAAGETNVGELIALLSLCNGFAGNDSGAMHLAAALWMPTVGIFGSTNPARTGPTGPRAGFIYRPIECSPCLQPDCRFGHYNCLRQVTPEEVAATLSRLGTFD